MIAPVVPLLTVTQRRVLEAIRAYVAEHGYPPTIREIGDAVRVAPSGVVYQLRQLEAAGWIRRHPGRPRSIVVRDPVDGSAA